MSYSFIRGMLAGDAALRKAIIIILVFGFVLIAFIWLSVYIKIQTERTEELNDARKETGNYARIFEEHTYRTVKGIDEIALFLKHEYEKDGKSINIPRFMNEGRFVGEPFILLSIVDEDGELVASSQSPFVQANISDREHFLVHRDGDSGQLFISRTLVGRTSGKAAIPMTRRINKPDGSFGGVVAISVDPYYFSEVYKQLAMDPHATITLVGRDGFVRLRQSGALEDYGQDLSGSALLGNMDVQTSGAYVSVSPIDGIKRIHSYRVLRDYPLAVSVGMAEAEDIFRDLNERVAYYYFFAGANTVIIAGFVTLLIRVAVRQKRTEKELCQVRDHLQSDIAERTRELYATNHELKEMNTVHQAVNFELHQTNLELQNEVADRKRIENTLQSYHKDLMRKNSLLMEAIETVNQTQQRMFQQEKLASVGQLAAGVAHEINNPLGFVTGNVEALEQYYITLKNLLCRYRELQILLAGQNDPDIRKAIDAIVTMEREEDLDYILGDLPALFADTVQGLARMSKIVKGMRLFSRSDQQLVLEEYSLNEGIESTLIVANNEIKHHAAVEKNLDELPAIEAVGGEINQVLLNIIINAVQAIKARANNGLGLISLSTWHDGGFAYCAIEDNGSGIEAENISRIFNPFFTTKPVGQGTGIGLSISYDIIVNRHNGEILVDSAPGKGTRFTLKLPLKQAREQADGADLDADR